MRSSGVVDELRSSAGLLPQLEPADRPGGPRIRPFAECVCILHGAILGQHRSPHHARGLQRPGLKSPFARALLFRAHLSCTTTPLGRPTWENNGMQEPMESFSRGRAALCAARDRAPLRPQGREHRDTEGGDGGTALRRHRGDRQKRLLERAARPQRARALPEAGLRPDGRPGGAFGRSRAALHAGRLRGGEARLP